MSLSCNIQLFGRITSVVVILLVTACAKSEPEAPPTTLKLGPGQAEVELKSGEKLVLDNFRFSGCEWPDDDDLFPPIKFILGGETVSLTDLSLTNLEFAKFFNERVSKPREDFCDEPPDSRCWLPVAVKESGHHIAKGWVHVPREFEQYCKVKGKPAGADHYQTNLTNVSVIKFQGWQF